MARRIPKLPPPKMLRKAIPRSLLRGVQRECERKELQWTNIFNVTVRRRQDPPDRQAAYGLVPVGTQHYPAQPLPALRKWGDVVLQLMRENMDHLPPMHLHTLGYVRATTSTPQLYHRDVPLSHSGAAFSVFTPVNVRCPDHDANGSRWRDEHGDEHPMGSHPGDVFIMDSRTLHRGGGKPRNCRGYRYVAFAAITEVGKPEPDYDTTVPAS